MERIQPNELASLIFGVVCAAIILYLLYREKLPRFGYFFLGFAFLLSANFFTVVEGFFWAAHFNFLEHLSYLLAGASFAAAAWDTRRDRDFT
jgi:hypothetical protein